jgi:outer membrane protein
LNLTRNPFLQALAIVVFLLSLSGCAEAPVKIGDGKIEKPLEQVTGLTTADVSNASQKSPLNLWDVYALAVERTEALATLVENVEQAHAQSQQALGAWLPQIFLDGTKGWQSSNYVGSGATPSGPNILSTSLYLSGTETLFTGLNQIAALQGSQASIDYQNYNLKNGAATLLLNVAQFFFNVLQLQDALQTEQASRDLTQKTLDQEKSWQAIGRAQKSDVLSTVAQLDQVIATLDSTQDQLIQAREALADLANIKPDTPLQSVDESFIVPGYTLEEALTKVDSRPDVKSAAASVAIADASLLQAHGEHLPSLSAQGSYYLDTEGSSPSPEWTVQLVASLPLFEGGQIVAEEDLAASKKRQAEMLLSLTRRDAVEQIREVYQGLVDSIQEMEAFQKAVDASQAAYEAVLHDYRLSLTTNLQVLTTLSTLETAQESYVKAKYQVLSDQIALGIATGDLPKIDNKDH